MSQFLHDDQGKAEGQATFEMTNLRPKDTNLDFVVWVSQKDNYNHDVRVKVGYTPRVFPHQMGTYGVRTFSFIAGQQLKSDDERQLELWIDKNRDVILAFWNGDIQYSRDFLEKIQPV